jgi:hypothetical protein
MDAAEIEDEEPGLAAVEEPKPISPLLDHLERPRIAVGDERVAEELGIPDRRELTVRDVVAGDAVEEPPGVGVEQ